MPPLQLVLVDFCLRVFRKMSVFFFWTIEDECYVGKFISLEKSRKGPVKLAFICTFMIMVEIIFLCYFTHFLSIIILFSLSYFSLLILWVWLETIFSCIKFALHAFWYGVEAMICLELERH